MFTHLCVHVHVYTCTQPLIQCVFQSGDGCEGQNAQSVGHGGKSVPHQKWTVAAEGEGHQMQLVKCTLMESHEGQQKQSDTKVIQQPTLYMFLCTKLQHSMVGLGSIHIREGGGGLLLAVYSHLLPVWFSKLSWMILITQLLNYNVHTT